METRRIELRNQILGSDATVGKSGFIDTHNGCVVTSQCALELATNKAVKVEEKREDRRNKVLSAS